MKSKRAYELLMRNHIEADMVFSEGDNSTETCTEAIIVAEEDARESAIKAFCTYCQIGCNCKGEPADICDKIKIYTKIYDNEQYNHEN